MKGLFFLTVYLASVAVADDFKTNAGKEYKNVTVSRVEPDGIVVTGKSGISKVYFTELPKDVQERFGYDSQKASDYSAQQSAGLEQVRKQEEEASRQKAEASQKANQQRAEQERHQNAVRAFQSRYDELQHQEDDLLLQIGQAKQPGPAHRVGKKLQHQPNPQKSQLPLLQSHLSDVRREKKQVRKELEKAQRQ
jgi:chromosome segregation ATPase